MACIASLHCLDKLSGRLPTLCLIRLLPLGADIPWEACTHLWNGCPLPLAPSAVLEAALLLAAPTPR